jgi:nickel-dependent lactate racemase
MPATLRYGADSSVRFELPQGVLLAECGSPHVSPLVDPARATAEALAEPLDYPPLSRSTTPGDRVVLPLEQGMPKAGEIAAAAIGALADAGVQPDGVTVLRTDADRVAGIGDPRPWLPREVVHRISVLAHDPTRRSDLAYLAATQAGEPILLNRAIVDADVVLPIGGIQSPAAPGYYGIHGAVYPAFSDQRTLRRFRSPASLDGRGRAKRKPGQVVDEVGWLLGVTLAVQLVPGPGDAVLHVVAGQIDAVRRRAREL